MKDFLILGFLTFLLPQPRAGAAAFQPDLNLAIRWNNAALQGIRDAKLVAPVVARALAIVYSCMYDAWSAYDERAVGTQLGGALRRPASERTLANKEQAIRYAAYRALLDVLPVGTGSVYIPLMKQLGYDPSDDSTDIETPTGIGNVACAAVLEYRHHDKSNQLGDLAQGPYSEWTGRRRHDNLLNYVIASRRQRRRQGGIECRSMSDNRYYVNYRARVELLHLVLA
jgi:hypothetical protein